jgi:hypothetical protein
LTCAQQTDRFFGSAGLVDLLGSSATAAPAHSTAAASNSGTANANANAAAGKPLGHAARRELIAKCKTTRAELTRRNVNIHALPTFPADGAGADGKGFVPANPTEAAALTAWQALDERTRQMVNEYRTLKKIVRHSAAQKIQALWRGYRVCHPPHSTASIAQNSTEQQSQLLFRSVSYIGCALIRVSRCHILIGSSKQTRQPLSSRTGPSNRPPHLSIGISAAGAGSLGASSLSAGAASSIASSPPTSGAQTLSIPTGSGANVNVNTLSPSGSSASTPAARVQMVFAHLQQQRKAAGRALPIESQCHHLRTDYPLRCICLCVR